MVITLLTPSSFLEFSGSVPSATPPLLQTLSNTFFIFPTNSGNDEGIERACRRSGVVETRNSKVEYERVFRRGGVDETRNYEDDEGIERVYVIFIINLLYYNNIIY